MKKLNYLFIVLITIQLNNSLAQGDNKLIIRARANQSSIDLNWFPSEPLNWKTGLSSGYSISREVMNGNSSSFPVKNIIPHSKEWFKVNVQPEAGTLFPIGEILYNPDFNLPSTAESETWTIKYNYVVYESTINQGVANATGLGFTDSTVVGGLTYKYTIKHNQSGQINSITLIAKVGEEVQAPADFKPDFTFPDGQSLGDMYSLSQPFVLKAIIGKAKPNLDSIILRWGPTTAEIWRTAMRDGYDIYRIDSTNISKKIATVFPWNESQLKSIPSNDSLALLAGSFVYNKGLAQQMENENFFEQANMTNNMHGFALMIADRSSLAADILGLRYVDRDVIVGETYIYEIKTKNLRPNLPVSDIRVTNYFEPILAPEGFKIIKGEKVATLQWSANSEITNYGSYVVDKVTAKDSVWQSLTPTPLVFIKDPTVVQNYYQFTDSLETNNVVYRYRVKGSNAFGEWSEYAYGLGYGLDRTPPESVEIISGQYEEDSNRLRISWKLAKDQSDLKYHQVLLSNDKDYNYAAISVELPPTDSVFYYDVKDLDKDRSFYFKVMSMDSSNNQTESILRYVSIPDHEKPITPENFHATIDTLGNILVSWSPSQSKDVEGYYIYYSDNDETELTLHNSYLHKDTAYTWNIDLNTITKYIYIGVKAEDDNYNKSNITDIIRLRRPDKIPPPKPFLTQAILDEEEKVYLSWKNSSATDVVKYEIYRKDNKDSLSILKLIDTISSEEVEYYDLNYPTKTQLSYAIKAVDDFNNISELSNALPINIPFPKNKYNVNFHKLLANKGMSVEMEWNKLDKKTIENQMNYKYQLFRSVGNEELQFFKEFNESENTFKDNVDLKNVLYNYAIRVKFDEERFGALSDVKSIIIQ